MFVIEKHDAVEAMSLESDVRKAFVHVKPTLPANRGCMCVYACDMNKARG